VQVCGCQKGADQIHQPFEQDEGAREDKFTGMSGPGIGDDHCKSLQDEQGRQKRQQIVAVAHQMNQYQQNGDIDEHPEKGAGEGKPLAKPQKFIEAVFPAGGPEALLQFQYGEVLQGQCVQREEQRGPG